MSSYRHRVSLGALALVACLALPAGLLSLLSETTTGEQVDAADLIVAARVASVQFIDAPERTAVEFAVDHAVLGTWPASTLNLTVDGRAPVEVGDKVLVLTKLRPAEALGIYQMQKNPRLLDDEIVTPITGMLSQGISGGDRVDAVPLSLFETAVRVRRGQPANGAGGAAAVAGGYDRGAQGQGGPKGTTCPAPDQYEPNDTLATATLTGLHQPSLMTGNPLILTGLTLHNANDVNFFQFEAGALQILHAETLEVTGLTPPDTLMGLFDVPSGDLLASDDDGGEGTLSHLVVPLEKTGPYAVAVESAPDLDLNFDGAEGLTCGTYSLSLELELGSYLWNQLDLIMGVSPDGTFIEDFIGFKFIGDENDVLLAGVPADGWALEYDVGPPGGLTHVYGGAGDQLTDPGFISPLIQIGFELGPLQDSAGFNRRGLAQATAAVGFTGGTPALGVIADTTYKLSLGDDTVRGDLALQMATHADVTNLTYTRVMDVDLFGPGPDQFSWSFDPTNRLQAFAVDTNTNVGNVVAPAQTFGQATGDMQAALVIKHGSSDGTGFADITHYKCAFTYVRGIDTSSHALNETVRKLRHVGIRTWVVAVDADPDTGLFSAFGAGLGR